MDAIPASQFALAVQDKVMHAFAHSKIKVQLDRLKNQCNQSNYACKKHYWTVLAAALVEREGGGLDVVSLACGTKSIGKKMMRSDGLCLHDCHAEVLARRGLLAHLAVYTDRYFTQSEEGKLSLKEGVKFHLYITEVPCGDASMGIISSEASNQKQPEAESLNKREAKVDLKKEGLWSGAKTLQGGMSLETGIARIKSGRSDMAEEQRSMSMSCSDKILMWNIVGFQGSLFLDLLHPKAIEGERIPIEIDLFGRLFFASITIEVEDACGENYQTIRRGIDPASRLKARAGSSKL